MRPRHDGISCPLQVECQQEPGDERQLSLTLQQQTVASDTEVSPAAASEESGAAPILLADVIRLLIYC